MANYKPYGETLVGFEGYYKSVINAKILFRNVAAQSVALAMKSSGGNVDYQVPTGKKFVAVGISLQATAAGLIAIYQGDTAAAITTIMHFIDVSGAGTFNVPLDFDIATGKYVTIDASGTNFDNCTIVGHEVEV